MKATIERIFGAVYSTKPGRLGMGLAVCSRILEAHGVNYGRSEGHLVGPSFS